MTEAKQSIEKLKNVFYNTGIGAKYGKMGRRFILYRSKENDGFPLAMVDFGLSRVYLTIYFELRAKCTKSYSCVDLTQFSTIPELFEDFLLYITEHLPNIKLMKDVPLFIEMANKAIEECIRLFPTPIENETPIEDDAPRDIQQQQG